MSKKKKGSMNTLVDIVIPFHISYDELERCLSCIPDAMGDIRYKVILVDNGNEINDQHREFFGNLSGIKVVRSSKNIGYPGGVNLGAKRSYSPLIFVLTSDVYLEPGSGEALVKAMDDDKVGIAGMKLIFPLDSDDPARPPGKIQHMGLHTNIRGEFVHTFVGWSPDNPRVNAIRDAYAVTGAAFMTRRNIWSKVKGFDLEYGLGYYEDMDYCMKVRELGYNIIVDKEAVAYHVAGASFAKMNDPSTQLNFNRNRMYFMQRWSNKLIYTEADVL